MDRGSLEACNKSGRTLCKKLPMYPWLTELHSDLKKKDTFDLTSARVFPEKTEWWSC